MSEEYLTQIRPGVPGKSPFWNGHASRFMYAPSLEFPAVAGSRTYRFKVASESDGRTRTFDAGEPWAPLTPIWKELPAGNVSVTVEGLDAGGRPVGVAGTRSFYRAPGFAGPYHRAARGYEESARRALAYLCSRPHYQRWLKEGDPDPNYDLYCYPSKIVGAVTSSMALYAKVCEASVRDRALEIAARAAEYLIGISEPAGAPLAFFPPTYMGEARTAKDFAGQIMIFCPAESANAYLDLHEVAPQDWLLEAATRIADTYVRLQLASGSWPLKVEVASGRRLSENESMPTGMIHLFERLIRRHGCSGYLESRDAAFRWIEERPLRDFHWEGQFEDSPLSKAYSNLARGHACEVARYLFDHADDNASYMGLAEEILRFAEDQFVVWEKPDPYCPEDPPTWLTPAVMEQYKCYHPIDASAATMIEAWMRAHTATGEGRYLDKARAMADTVTVAQDPETSRYPTYWSKVSRHKEGWINCAARVAATMFRFAEYERSIETSPKAERSEPR